MGYPTPSLGSAQGSGAFRKGPTDVPSAKQVILAALQSGTELALILAGTPSSDVETARALLNGVTDDIGTSDLATINAALGSALVSTDEWDDVADTIDAL